VSSTSPKLLSETISGMLGLGLPALMETPNTVPWWIRLIQDGQLGPDQTLFAFWLSRFVVDIVS